MMQIGQLVKGVMARLHRGEKDTVQLIEGGPNAPHLANRPVDFREDDLKSGQWEAEVKLDGIRCLYIDGRLVTLEGQPMNCARHCLPALRKLEDIYGQAMFFDGEYVEEEGFEATLSAFRKGEGQGTLWLFDAVPLDDWRDNQDSASWRARKAQLLTNHHAIPDADGAAFVGALRSWPVGDAAAAQFRFHTMRINHYEGIVLKRKDAPYRRERNGDWLRMKPHDCTDMRLIDILGSDKAGARKLLLRDPDTRSPVTLTKGFASSKLVIWENRDVLLGNDDVPAVMVEVKHCGRTAKGHPRHAVFGKLRHDKLPSPEEEEV